MEPELNGGIPSIITLCKKMLMFKAQYLLLRTYYVIPTGNQKNTTAENQLKRFFAATILNSLDLC